MLEKEDICDKMLTSLASLSISFDINIQFLAETDPICMNLFFLLGLLPGGATEDELSDYWDYLS